MKKITLFIFLFSCGLSNAQWTQQILSDPIGLSSLYAFDPNNICAVGQYLITSKTTNGGNNWTNYGSTNTVGWFQDVDFTDTNTGYASTNMGSIYKTTNSGLSWVQVATGFTQLHSIAFINPTTGYSVGFSGDLIKTTDAGVTWNNVLNISSQRLNEIYFYNSTIGYIVGNNGVIYKTTNGGLNWSSQISNTTSSLFTVHFADENTGWCAGSSGTIVKTIDGGANWIIQNSNITAQGLNGLYAINTNIAYTVGTSGTILYTTNGGLNWNSQMSNTNNHLQEIKFVDTNVGYIVGLVGTILKTTNAGLNVNENNFQLKKTISYPNPFKSSFTIKIDNYETLSNATLTIFDLLGNKVDEMTELNQNEISIDRKNLNSGMYLYYIKEQGNLISKGKIIAE